MPKVNEYKQGISYVGMGEGFTDPIHVYVGKDTPIKVGIIIFVEKKKKVYNGYKHEVSRYTDGFIFEIEGGVSVECNDYKNIAKYVYGLNEKYKEMKKKNG